MREAQHRAGAQARRVDKAKRARAGKQVARRNIPASSAANALAIYDGQDIVATCVERDGLHFLFGPDDELIGEYPTRAATMAALPSVSP